MSLKTFILDNECKNIIPKGINTDDSGYYIIMDTLTGRMTLCYDLFDEDEDEEDKEILH